MTQVVDVVFERQFLNLIVEYVEDELFTLRPELFIAFEESIINRSFRTMVFDNDCSSTTADNPVRQPFEVGRSLSSCLPTLFSACFLSSESTTFLPLSTEQISNACGMMDNPTIHDIDEYSENQGDDIPICSSPNCHSVTPHRFLKILQTEEDWLCLPCVEATPLKKLKFLINNVSPGNCGLDWCLTEPAYGPHDRERYKIEDDEMWFTLFVGVPFGISSHFTPCWSDVRCIMKKPSPSLFYS
jgi:hypothetical protein